MKVLDFGLAHAFGQARPDGGTPAYMAPEQRRGAPEDERTDVFALGVMLYQMLSGELPFADDEGDGAGTRAGARARRGERPGARRGAPAHAGEGPGGPPPGGRHPLPVRAKMYTPPPTRNRPTVSSDGGRTWEGGGGGGGEADANRMVGSQMVTLLDTLWAWTPE